MAEQSSSYTSPGAVEAAISEAARKAHATDPSLSVSERVRREHHRRFLSRVFHGGTNSEWVLKGGNGLLARTMSGRSTTDIDLVHPSVSLERALEDLRRLAEIDLGDFFRFQYRRHSARQLAHHPGIDGSYRIMFDVYLGVKGKGALAVDLVIETVFTDRTEMTEPSGALWT